MDTYQRSGRNDVSFKGENKMTIEKIDDDLCLGCGVCINSCPTDVIRMNEKSGKAEIRYPEECTLCAVCEMDCSEGAIYVGIHKEGPLPTHW